MQRPATALEGAQRTAALAATRLRRLLRDPFLLGLVSAVALATAAPDVGRSGGPLRGDRLADAGVFAIFLLHGLALSPQRLRAGLLRWKLHAFVQAFTFGVFPLLGALLGAAFGRLVPPHLRLGFLYLCALPSTISSSVAMTALARGNVPGAIFNATLSSVLGVVATPVLVGLATRTSGHPLPLARAAVDLAFLVVLPLGAGQLLRPALGSRVERHARLVNTFDKVIIVLVVYVSFCESVGAGLWRDHGAGVVALALAGAGLLLAVALSVATRAARFIGLGVEDEIAAVFCGSKKGLAAGVAMAKVLFGGHPGLGLIVLPIMLYHQLQLFVCSLLAERYARRP